MTTRELTFHDGLHNTTRWVCLLVTNRPEDYHDNGWTRRLIWEKNDQGDLITIHYYVKKIKKVRQRKDNWIKTFLSVCFGWKG